MQLDEDKNKIYIKDEIISPTSIHSHPQRNVKKKKKKKKKKIKKNK